MHQHFGKSEGLKIAIVGDTQHSRVAASNQRLHEKLGNEVKLYSDQDENNWDEILKADVLMMLRVQFERHQDSHHDNTSYLQKNGLTMQRYSKLKPNAIVMHPGPFNRDMEIASEVINQPKVKIFEQVSYGVPARMAIFDYVLGGLS